MHLIAHGIDIVEIRRVVKLLEDPDQEFLRAAFTALELQLAPDKSGSAGYYAGRIAAKEAVAKALGTGFSRGVSWGDIEIIRDDAGAPRVVLSGQALEVATQLGVRRWLLSISHCQDSAVASVIAVDD